MEAATSLLCSLPIPTSHLHLLVPRIQTRLFRTVSHPSRHVKLPFKPLHNYLHATSPLRSTATQEIVETVESGLGFIEVGYISGVHGLRGEIRLKPSTDFPELRFCKPGRRWLRQQSSVEETIKEVELVGGREHSGRKSWILRFEGVDTVDQARLLVGSTLLVREDDRPVLAEGEFYSHDLVGMRVILKETGECVGSVVNVFNTGASDLLHVLLYQSVNTSDGTQKLNAAETGKSGPFAWVPFVEAIVPDVDMNKREMWITPPKGLLELNLRTDELSKKERRQLEWKERKKFQRRLIAAKKKLVVMEQKHVFDGFRYGEKSQRRFLADEIVGVNSILLQHALKNLCSKRWSATEIIGATRSNAINSLKLPKECLVPCASKKNLGAKQNFIEKGLPLLSEGKAAMVLVLDDVEKSKTDNIPDFNDSKSSERTPFSFLQKSFSDDQAFIKVEDRACLPLILVCPVQEIGSLMKLFSDNDYFAFDPNKVLFLEEERLPVVTNSVEENRYKILMKSPWEILQSPVGSGGVLSLLSSHDILESLTEMGVQYIEVSSSSQKFVAGNSLLLGFVSACKAEIGIQISEDSGESFDMIFSMNFMKRLTKHIHKLQFYAVPKLNSHVELVDKEWTDVVPSSENSYELHSSIYSSLDACRPDKICVVEITD